MRAITANLFECKIRYEKVMNNGKQKRVTEQYVVDAMSFAEAEARIIEEMSAYVSGAFEVTDVRKASYKEVFVSDDVQDSRYYKAKLAFITVDERTGEDKRTTATYLVQAATFDGAVKNINDMMGTTMIDYEKSNISETQIMDVFEYTAKNADNDGK
mgnify:CR=1 FL=1